MTKRRKQRLFVIYPCNCKTQNKEIAKIKMTRLAVCCLGYRRTSMSVGLGSRQHVRPILNFCPCKHQQDCCRTLIDCVIQHKVSCPVHAFSTPGPSHKFTGICPKW